MEFTFNDMSSSTSSATSSCSSSFDKTKNFTNSIFEEVSCFTDSVSSTFAPQIPVEEASEETTSLAKMQLLQTILAKDEEQSSPALLFDEQMEERITNWLDTMNIFIAYPGKERRTSVNLTLQPRKLSSLLIKRKQSSLN